MPSTARRPKLELRAESRAPLSVLVSRQLRKVIVSGALDAGAELPSEKELTQDLGVGRSTVREALRILHAQGLLSGGETVSTRRARISSAEVLRRAAALAMENAIRLGRVPTKDLVAVRVLLEGAGVEGAARRGRHELEPARAALAEMRAAGGDVARFRAADLAFHRAIVGASGNAALPLLMDALRAAIAGALGEALHRAPAPERAMAKLTREHAAILRAIEDGDVETARRLLARHVTAFYVGEAST